MISWLKYAWSAIVFGWDNRKKIAKVAESIQDVVDPEPDWGPTPKTHADVVRTQKQIDAAVSHKVKK